MKLRICHILMSHSDCKLWTNWLCATGQLTFKKRLAPLQSFYIQYRNSS